jgi:hypothetical protein
MDIKSESNQYVVPGSSDKCTVRMNTKAERGEKIYM